MDKWITNWNSLHVYKIKRKVDYKTKKKNMSERKSKNIFFIVYGLIVITMLLCSCGTGQLTQKQVKINYELDKLWIKYKYESDSLINEFYKKW